MSKDFIASLISSLLPIFITLLFAWISSRNDQAKRRHLIDDAKQRIELINAYVASQNLVLNDPNELEVIKKIAAKELYGIKSFLDSKLQSLEKSSEKSESFFQRFFLLYKMRTGLASLFRVGFFSILLLSVLFTILISSTSFSPSSIQEFGLVFNIVMVTIASVPGILFAMLLRWLTIKFDKPSSSTIAKEEQLQ